MFLDLGSCVSNYFEMSWSIANIQQVNSPLNPATKETIVDIETTTLTNNAAKGRKVGHGSLNPWSSHPQNLGNSGTQRQLYDSGFEPSKDQTTKM